MGTSLNRYIVEEMGELDWKEGLLDKMRSLFSLGTQESIAHLEGQDKEVLTVSLELQNTTEFDFDDAFSLFLSWCQGTLKRL